MRLAYPRANEIDKGKKKDQQDREKKQRNAGKLPAHDGSIN